MASEIQLHLLLSLLLCISTVIVTAAAMSPPPPHISCSNQVVAFSPCLQYISLPPNNRTLSPSVECCHVYSAAFDNRTAACLCYLLRRPQLLGFPIDTTRVLFLSSLCPLPSDGAQSAANHSLESFCSGSSALPPLQAIVGPGVPRHPHFPRLNWSHESPPPPPKSPPSPPDVADDDTLPSALNLSIITPTSPLQPTPIHSAAKQISTNSCLFSLIMLIVLIPTFSYLQFYTHR